MRWQRVIAWVGLFLAWAALAAWQYHEYGHEQELARQILRRQADSLMNALVGGIRSHRRMGRFFLGQLQGTLDELVRSKDILAVSIAFGDGRPVASAGAEKGTRFNLPEQPGGCFAQIKPGPFFGLFVQAAFRSVAWAGWAGWPWRACQVSVHRQPAQERPTP